MNNDFDVVIIGAGFAGLTLARHLPKKYRILLIERKPQSDSVVESTGLITAPTYQALKEFINVDKNISNKISTIGVIAPDYENYFFSTTAEPWIYSTDTPQLLKTMAADLPDNITVEYSAEFKRYESSRGQWPLKIFYKHNGDGAINVVGGKMLVGADGARSLVAAGNSQLDKNRRFLIGVEKVFLGQINFGPQPNNTVFHFWFGEFSLGYGGWLSPTLVNGRPAFRIGLAKLAKNADQLNKLDEFIKIAAERNIFQAADPQPLSTYGNYIPINGPLKKISAGNVLLIGDAAGFCGAFAADGIKGAVTSGKVAAKLIDKYLNGQPQAFQTFHQAMQAGGRLMTYYQKQLRYRFIWDIMKTDRTFQAMYNVIANQQHTFLQQFCDTKNRGASLLPLLFSPGQWRYLIAFAWYLFIDALKRPPAR